MSLVGWRPRPATVVVGVLGVALTGAHLGYVVAARGALSRAVSGVTLLGSLGLFWAAWQVERSCPDGRCGRRVVVWTVCSTLGLSAVAAVTLLNQAAEGGRAAHVGYTVAAHATAGAFVGTLAGLYDARRVRERDRAEDAAAHANAERDRATRMFENAPVAMLEYEFVDGDALIRRVNPAFGGTVGLDAEAVLGRPVLDVLVPRTDTTRTLGLRERLVEDGPVEFEAQRRTSEGLREFLVTAALLDEAGARGFSVVLDVTERERRDQRLDVLNRVLRHDLRNAVNVIRGTAESLLAAERAPRAPVERIAARAGALSRTADAAREIQEVLGSSPLELRALDLDALIRERVTVAREAFADRPLSVSVETAEDVTVAAPAELSVALDHLIENAVVHNDADEPRLSVALSVEGEEAELRVEDNGPGIPERELSVLEREYETDLEHASGLGLWLVKWIVTDAGGSVRFDSAAAGGTVVVLRLPLAETVADVDATERIVPDRGDAAAEDAATRIGEVGTDRYRTAL